MILSHEAIAYDYDGSEGCWLLMGSRWIFGIYVQWSRGADYKVYKVRHANPDNYDTFQHPQQFLAGEGNDGVIEIEAFQMCE